MLAVLGGVVTGDLIGHVPVIACMMEEIILLENDLEGQTDSILCHAISIIH